MKVTIIGKPEDYIKQSRPEDVLKYAKSDQKVNDDSSKGIQDIDFNLDETER